MHERFRKVSSKISLLAGSSYAFLLALSIVLVWAVVGPLFQFSQNWQIVINTFTTIVTFLMGFIIQNTQNRDSKAVHIKLDELLRSAGEAKNELIDLEEQPDEVIQAAKETLLESTATADQIEEVAEEHMSRDHNKTRG